MRYVKVEGYTVFSLLNNLVFAATNYKNVYLLDREAGKVSVVSAMEFEEITKIIKEITKNDTNRYEFYYKTEV